MTTLKTACLHTRVRFDFETQITSFAVERKNRKTDFIFQKFVLRVDFNLEIQIRISWIYSLPFDWEIRKRICKTVLVKSGLFSLIMRACVRLLFLTTVSFKSLFGFSNRTVKRKSKNRFLSVEIRFWISRSIANPRSGF